MSANPITPITKCKLLSRHEVAERTMAFRFEKPSGWKFKAGQFLDMLLPIGPVQSDKLPVKIQKLPSGEIFVKIGLLRQEPDLLLYSRIAQRLPEEPDLPGRRPSQPHEELEGGGLACAVRP